MCALVTGVQTCALPISETRDMVAAEVPVAFACNGEPFAVMMATPEDLEDFAFGFALAEGIVASADEVVIDSIETSLEGVAIALSIPSDRASVLEARRRSLEGRSEIGRAHVCTPVTNA